MYKRYMVFSWDVVDNEKPFDCVDDTFDDLQQAKDYIASNDLINRYEDSGNPQFCIFDRISGLFVS